MENKALRLKEDIIRQVEEENPNLKSGTADSRLSWQYFDEKDYVSRKVLKAGEDSYLKNKFNQAESDKLASNRDVPDTRHYKSVFILVLNKILVCS